MQLSCSAVGAFSRLLALAVALQSVVFNAPLAAEDGAWQQAHKVRIRLTAGYRQNSDQEQVLAFVEMELEPGWKTYWRHPGEAGGIPPEFNFEASRNLAEANVLYPAPVRMTDSIGDTVGYKNTVVFPVQLRANDTAKPVDLGLAIRFGICKDICIPTEANLAAVIAAERSRPIPAELEAALDRVPRDSGSLAANDPKLVGVSKPVKAGEMWSFTLQTSHNQKAADQDLFLEAPEGIFVPVPKRKAPKASQAHASYSISLSQGEYEALQGQTLQATVVDNLGASQSQFVLR